MRHPGTEAEVPASHPPFVPRILWAVVLCAAQFVGRRQRVPRSSVQTLSRQRVSEEGEDRRLNRSLGPDLRSRSPSQF